MKSTASWPPESAQGRTPGQRAGDRGEEQTRAAMGLLRRPTGIFDMSRVDTNPGANCVMAPAANHHPTPIAYRNAIWHRFRSDPGTRQHMGIYARRLCGSDHCAPLAVFGPYAREALEILRVLGDAVRG